MQDEASYCFNSSNIFYSISLKSLDSETTISHTPSDLVVGHFHMARGKYGGSKKTDGHIITDPLLLEDNPHKQCKTFDMCNTMRIPATKTYKTPLKLTCPLKRNNFLKGSRIVFQASIFEGLSTSTRWGSFFPSTTRGCCISPPTFTFVFDFFSPVVVVRVASN